MFVELFHSFIRDEGGQDIVEYSLLLVLIAAVAMTILTAMGKSITAIFAKVNNTLTSANNSLS